MGRIHLGIGLGHDLLEGALRLRTCETHVPVCGVDNDELSISTTRHNWNQVFDSEVNLLCCDAYIAAGSTFICENVCL